MVSGVEEDAAGAVVVGEGAGAELVDDDVVPGRMGPPRFCRVDVLGQGRPALVASLLLSTMGKEYGKKITVVLQISFDPKFWVIRTSCGKAC